MVKAAPQIEAAFRSGVVVPWSAHDHALFHRTGYAANLVSAWLPALDGVEAKLKAGTSVADIGCGHGAATILMAQAYPRARFVGVDNHPESIAHARQAAAQAGVADRVLFEVASATAYDGAYDPIAFFDSYHNMGDPVAVARYARQKLGRDGTLLLVEPMAGERIEDNLNPVGRLFSAGSTMICTPNGLATGGHALGAQASDQQIRELVLAGGFTRFRRAAQTPFNRVFEARP